MPLSTQTHCELAQPWYEALSAPGLLRIDIAPLEDRHTLIFRADSLYKFKGDRLTESRALVQTGGSPSLPTAYRTSWAV